MIYTVTFNPALDYIMRLPRLEAGETNRSTAEAIFFGGKGINVSRVLKELGQETTLFGFIAGFTGDALAEALEKMGLRTDFVRLPKGMTRINVKIKETAETEINAGGPPISEEALQALLQKLETLQAGDTLVLAGSIPASVPKDIYCTVAERMAEKGVRAVVDATGELLLNTLKHHPFLIKPNHRELEELAGSADAAPTPAPAETDDPETYVYATVSSKLYHTTSCRRFCYSSHKYTLYEAHFSGYSPCDLCNPGVYGQ